MGQIAVIGAGMAGLSASRRLSEAGRSVVVFDKSRGVGGRLATRRTSIGPFDHGAPAVHGDGIAAFADDMNALETAEPVGAGWYGVPGMSGLLKPWLDGVERRSGIKVDRLDGRSLIDETGASHGPFDAVIVAIPAPQAQALTGTAALGRVVMEPVWTLLAAWSERQGAVVEPVDTIDRIVPQRGAPGRWIAHARIAWSRANLERDKDDVARDLLETLRDALGIEGPADYAEAHRWRYAHCAEPLGAPFLDCGDGVLAGGDWALGRHAGHAFSSGRAMADAVLRMALSPPARRG